MTDAATLDATPPPPQRSIGTTALRALAAALGRAAARDALARALPTVPPAEGGRA